MNVILQQHGTPEWPEAWCVYNRTGETHNGSHVRLEGGKIVYRCDCGSTFTREPGFDNERTSDWVARHRHHLVA